MAMTAAERQKRYRERHGRNAGKCRINLIVTTAAVMRLNELARQYGVYKQEMLERVIFAFESLRSNELEAKPHAPDHEAERLLALAGGNTERALAVLTEEATQALPGFTWKKAAGKQASPEYKRFREVQKCLCSQRKRAVQSNSQATGKPGQAEFRADQLAFEFW